MIEYKQKIINTFEYYECRRARLYSMRNTCLKNRSREKVSPLGISLQDQMIRLGEVLNAGQVEMKKVKQEICCMPAFDHYASEVVRLLLDAVEVQCPQKLAMLVYYLVRSHHTVFFALRRNWTIKSGWNALVVAVELFLMGVWGRQSNIVDSITQQFPLFTPAQQLSFMFKYSWFLCSSHYLCRKQQQKLYYFSVQILNQNLDKLCTSSQIQNYQSAVRRSYAKGDEQKEQLEQMYLMKIEEKKWMLMKMEQQLNLLYGVHGVHAGEFGWQGKEREVEEVMRMKAQVEGFVRDKLMRRVLDGDPLNDIREECRRFPADVSSLRLYHNDYQKALYQLRPALQVQLPPHLMQMSEFQHALCSCYTSEDANHLSTFYLQHLCSYSNNLSLLNFIFSHTDVSNMPFMCKILATISKQESTRTMQDQIEKRVFGDQEKGWFIAVQMVKFGVVEAVRFLEKVVKKEQKLGVEGLLELAERLGRPIYYLDIQTHIVFNQFLDNLRSKVKKTSSGDLMQKLKSFQLYLYQHELPKTKPSFSSNLFPTLASLKSAKNLSPIIRAFQRHKNNSAEICAYFEENINQNDFMSVDCWARLIHDVNLSSIDDKITKLTKKNIKQKLTEGDGQTAGKWSKLFGQLFFYQIIELHDLVRFLKEVVDDGFQANPGIIVQAFCSCLSSCKESANQTQSLKMINEILLLFLSLKRKIIIKGRIENKILQDELSDLMEYFHPSLTEAFNTVEEIDKFLEKTNTKKYNVQKMMNMTYDKLKRQSSIKYVEAKKESSIKTSEESVVDELALEFEILDLHQPIEQKNVNDTKKSIKVISRKKDERNKIQAKQINVI